MSNSDGPLNNVPWMVAGPLHTASRGELFCGIPLEIAMRMRYREVPLIKDAKTVLLNCLPMGPLLKMDDGYVRFKAGRKAVYRYTYSDPSENVDALTSVGMSETICFGWYNDDVLSRDDHGWAMEEVRRILDGCDEEIPGDDQGTQ